MARKPTNPEAETAEPEAQAAPEPEVTPEPEAQAAPEAAVTPEPEAPKQETPQKTAATLVVTGPREGRRRAGRHFGAEPVSIRLDDLSEAEWDAIEGDPALTTQIVNAPY